MKKLSMNALLALAISSASLGVTAARAANADNLVSAGGLVGAGGGSSAAAFTAEYERLMTDWLSLGIRVGGMSYDFAEESYDESGDGTGVDAAVRFYFRGQGMEGPHVGFHLGVWQTDWEWTDPNERPRSGAGTSDAVNVSATFAWKFRLGESFIVEPNVSVGDFLADSTDDTSTQEQELGFYAGVGVAIGFAF